MPFQKALPVADLPPGTKKAVQIGDTEILLIHTAEQTLHAVEAKCPHAGAPLVDGAVCNGRLICPWHTATYALAGDALPEGTLLEPPALRSLRHYSVEIEGDSILVDPAPMNHPTLAAYNSEAPAPALHPERHIVTIGGGAAAAAAVTALRQGGFAGRLTVIDPILNEPVDRTNLSKMTLAGKKPADTLPLWSPEERANLRVDRLEASVTALDGTAGTLTTSTGQALQFDAALFAPGGTPKTLGIPGEDLPHVVSIRHVADVEHIATLLGGQPEGKTAVLIGDSFIAFEAASALTTRGLKVTVVAQSEQPFAKKFGPDAANAILALHKSKGVTLKASSDAQSISAESVTLKSGETLPADLVLVAIGVQPATGFAHGLPLEQDGGIPVAPSLQAAPHVWVAGDVASVEGVRIEHWRLAQQHGRSAAGAMLLALGASPLELPAPEREPFHGVPFFWTAHFGKRFGYVGHASDWDELQIDGELGTAPDGSATTDPAFLAYYVKDQQVAAILGCGKDSAIAALAESMRSPLTLTEARTAAANA